MKHWTEAHIKQLQAAGRIRGYTVIGTKKPQDQHRIATKNRSKTKEWIALNLTAWCKVNGFELVPEYKFCEERKWRFDWFLPELNTGIEYEGINSAKSRHTTKRGYTGDTDKYTTASIKGFIVIRITALNYKSLFTHLEAIKNKPQ